MRPDGRGDLRNGGGDGARLTLRPNEKSAGPRADAPSFGDTCGPFGPVRPYPLQIIPPFTWIVCPVMNELSCEARKT